MLNEHDDLDYDFRHVEALLLTLSLRIKMSIEEWREYLRTKATNILNSIGVELMRQRDAYMAVANV